MRLLNRYTQLSLNPQGTFAAPDLSAVPQDLFPPQPIDAVPGAGRRVWQALPGYAGSDLRHALYLPVDWSPGALWPVVVEYPGNGPFNNEFGDKCGGEPADCALGYGLGGGRGLIWLSLPFVSADHARHERQWWGDRLATAAYCLEAVAQTCARFGGDPARLLLAGFSRGSIACNYIGLLDNAISCLWAGFICHSHYDGVRRWGCPEDGRPEAAERLARLRGRPQFISHELSVEPAWRYLSEACPDGDFAFLSIPFRNHSAGWTLRPLPERQLLRDWAKGVIRL